MIVVWWTPREDDPTSGPITGCTDTPDEFFNPRGRSYIEVTERRATWDVTHEVVAYVVTPRAPDVLMAEARETGLRQLRMLRDTLLRNDVDAVANSRFRWSALTPDQQAAYGAYRQALLDWPETETDPLNPTPPVLEL